MRAAFISLGALLLAVSACELPTSTGPVPSGWKRIDAGRFTFSVPPDFKPLPSSGIDSFVGDYRGDGITLGFDYGRYSNPLEYVDKSETQRVETHERIGGKQAKVVSYHHQGHDEFFDEVVAVHFSAVDSDATKLTMEAYCRTVADRYRARLILRSITFK